MDDLDLDDIDLENFNFDDVSNKNKQKTTNAKYNNKPLSEITLKTLLI